MINEEETNIIDTSTTDNSICAICKIELKENPKDQDKLYCPRCHREYLPGSEISEFEDDMISVHENEQVELGGLSSGSGLLVENDDDDIMKPTKQTRLKIPLKEGETLVSYEEYIPDPD